MMLELDAIIYTALYRNKNTHYKNENNTNRKMYDLQASLNIAVDLYLKK